MRIGWRTIAAVLVTAGFAVAAGGWSARAQIPVQPTTTTVPPQTTTTSPPQTTTTTRPPTPGPTLPRPTPTPTTTPRPTTTTTGPPGPPPGQQPSASPGLIPPGGIPPDMQALINSIKRSGASSTSKLIDALKPLQDFGLTPQEAALVGFGHFPVAGDAAFRDDFLEYRAGPPPHLHQGNLHLHRLLMRCSGETGRVAPIGGSW